MSEANEVDGVVKCTKKDYELYVCGHNIGCKTLLEFDCEGDMGAVDIARRAINDYEKETGDYIYREYLFRNCDDGEQIELCI